MPRPRTLSEHVEALERSPSGRSAELPRARTLGGPPLTGARRFWGVLPVAIVIALFALRACLHTAPLDRLAPAANEPADPPGTNAYTGSIAITRGGPVIVGFQSDSDARLVVAGHELRGRGTVKDRIVIPHGAAPIRFAARPGARLVWSPVGRRGDLEYMQASSLSPDPPATATFDDPGTATLDGAIAAALLVTLVASLCIVARRRLAAVSRNTWFAMAAIFAVAFAVRLVGLGDQGQTWDEDVNWAAGRNYVTNVLALDFSDRSWSWNYEHPPVMKLLDGVGAQFSDGFGPARALSALWIALGCALLVPIGARLYKLRVGVLAAAIAALLPPLVAHGQVVGHESPTVLWWSLGVMLALGVHDYLPSNDRRALRTLQLRLVSVGAVVGIAIASRFVNGLLGPLVALIVVVQAPPRWRNATIGWGAALLPLAAIATFILVWPRMWGNPFPALSASLAKLDTPHAPEPFLGTITNHPPPYYFAVYLFATLPLGILAGVVAYAVRAGIQRDRSALLVGAWFVIPLLVALSPVRQDGVRYVMPCLGALAVMAAAGVDFLATLADKRIVSGPGARDGNVLRRRPVFIGASAAVIVYLAITVARTSPYYLDYFAEHTGGAGAVARSRAFETAWWGEGLDRAVDYVNTNAAPNARVYRECIEPVHLAWFREDLWLPMTRDATQAQWLVVYAPASHSCPLPTDARRVFTVEHDGVVMAAVYQR